MGRTTHAEGEAAARATARAAWTSTARSVGTAPSSHGAMHWARAEQHGTARYGPHNSMSMRVFPKVLGLTRARSRNSATPSSWLRTISAKVSIPTGVPQIG